MRCTHKCTNCPWKERAKEGREKHNNIEQSMKKQNRTETIHKAHTVKSSEQTQKECVHRQRNNPTNTETTSSPQES